MPECFGVPVVTSLVCFFVLHMRLWVRRAPGIPCALSAQTPRVCRVFGGTIFARLGHARCREIALSCPERLPSDHDECRKSPYTPVLGLPRPACGERPDCAKAQSGLRGVFGGSCGLRFASDPNPLSASYARRGPVSTGRE